MGDLPSEKTPVPLSLPEQMDRGRREGDGILRTVYSISAEKAVLHHVEAMKNGLSGIGRA